MNFEELGLKPRMVELLAEQGITDPTPIQVKAIPLALEGRDVMGLAQTGTGKTAAFGLPLIHYLNQIEGKAPRKGARALILAPTRELAKQIQENLASYTRGNHLRVNLVVGGVSINAQANRLERGTDILVATPGRLIDLLDRGAVTLDEASYLVLDEADQMLDMGFIHALRRIAPLLPEPRQTMLFSATMPKDMAELAKSYLKDPVRVETAPPGKPADKVDQVVHFLTKGEKPGLLSKLLAKHPGELALVFARTKHGAERLMKSLVAEGFNAAAIHGNKSQGQRDRAIKAFRDGQIEILVATDVAARGLDIPGVAYVYNFDLPNVPDNYVHRIGRTARAGRDGTAIAFCAPDEMGELRDIQKTMKRDIPVAEGNFPWKRDQEEAKPKRGGGRNGGGGNRRGKPNAGKPGGAAGKPKQSHGGRGAPGGKPGGSRRRRGGSGGGGRSRSMAAS